MRGVSSVGQFARAAGEQGERGIDAGLVTVRDEGHDFLRAENRRLFRRAAADWLERHLNRRPAGPVRGGAAPGSRAHPSAMTTTPRP